MCRSFSFLSAGSSPRTACHQPFVPTLSCFGSRNRPGWPGRGLLLHRQPGRTRQLEPDLWAWTSSSNSPRRLTNYASAAGTLGITSLALSPDGSQAAYALSVSGGFEGDIHVVDLASGSDRLLVKDTAGCALPLAISIGCSSPA